MGALPALSLVSGALVSGASPSTGSGTTRPSAALVRSTALELVILACHTLLYPTGVTQERRPPPLATPLAPEGNGIANDRVPVLLLHGFADNRSVFVLLRRSLLRHGWRHVASLNHSLLTRDIRTAAAALSRYVEEFRARTGAARIDVVGHSLGGLVARYHVQRLGGDALVRRVITLGTPHGGTLVAPPMSAHPLVRQMRPGSELLRELTAPAPGCRTRFVAFWSDLDQVMVPVETARLDHPDLVVRNIRVSGVGHLALPVHPTVVAGIRQALASRDESGDDAGRVSVA
ncbi:alpha/beta fold hydrolase [Streptomyces mobaraensis NBRC 13819 = DSM 40847]|uniref:Lipase n=1 Tax=Streptomyces mobaraensis (strain ATCC 29032 / DSM 40847 / JCM 4168 / NBRC 13819 / NCIMB 11159 / IPCR 16-22) TaxID=1223523 RepID=M3BJ79_STRM1|nr:alpha/beta fold hydrolase [Streptomyces mobaraensis]EME99644.1 lipase [Streptomyces mobaraensis NBRC 13819 = DSM 40847]QTT75296.1 alpha/beta fold hydrolase [Streptomyces mobaraensis NBRC 13819 = DSM 40847]